MKRVYQTGKKCETVKKFILTFPEKKMGKALCL